MIELIAGQLTDWGLREEWSVELAFLLLMVGLLLMAIVLNYIVRGILIRLIHSLIKKSRFHWDDVAIKQRTFSRLAHFAPAILFYTLAPLFLLEGHAWTESFVEFIRRFAMIYMIVAGVLVLDSLFNTINQVYEGLEIAKTKPIKSYFQVTKLILILFAVILVLSIVLNRSPWAFLTGLGAIAAVLILVFKDTILGLVAGVQNAAYDIIRIGDWIEMPKYGVDGDVIEISLNTIKVQNWDKTVVSIPTGALLTESIKNWRGMTESGGRRIKRHVNIDMNTIKFCDEEMLGRFSKFLSIQEYIEKKKQEISKHNKGIPTDTATLINGRHLTNVGTFRAYLQAYLRNHSSIHQNLTFLIRQLQPTEMGLPIEIYVFTNDTRWVEYEGIQADIFDHILAVLPLFDLAVFQETSGQRYKIDIVSTPEMKTPSN